MNLYKYGTGTVSAGVPTFSVTSTHYTYLAAPTGHRFLKINQLASGSTISEYRFVPDASDTCSEYEKPANASLTYARGYVQGLDIDAKIARIESDETTRYYCGDALGSVTHLLDNSAAVLNTQVTNSWGESILDSQSVADRFGLSQREKDSESGVMHFRARFYDPRIGRFGGKDPLLSGLLKHYTYCSNSPTDRRDPTGEQDAIEWARKKRASGQELNASERASLEREDAKERAMNKILDDAMGPASSGPSMGVPGYRKVEEPSVVAKFATGVIKGVTSFGPGYLFDQMRGQGHQDTLLTGVDKMFTGGAIGGAITRLQNGDVLGYLASNATLGATDQITEGIEAVKSGTTVEYAGSKVGQLGQAYVLGKAVGAISRVGGSQSEVGGPYSNLVDSPTVGPGKGFTTLQKAKVLEENSIQNGGVIKSDQSGKVLVKPQQHTKGVTPPSNEAHIDHIHPRSKGGSNSYGNAQVLSRDENLEKGARDPNK